VNGDPPSLLGDAAIGARRDHVVDWEKEPVRSSRLLAPAWLAAVGITAGAIGLASYLLVGDAFALWLGVGIAVACSVAGDDFQQPAVVIAARAVGVGPSTGVGEQRGDVVDGACTTRPCVCSRPPSSSAASTRELDEVGDGALLVLAHR